MKARHSIVLKSDIFTRIMLTTIASIGMLSFLRDTGFDVAKKVRNVIGVSYPRSWRPEPTPVLVGNSSIDVEIKNTADVNVKNTVDVNVENTVDVDAKWPLDVDVKNTVDVNVENTVDVEVTNDPLRVRGSN